MGIADEIAHPEPETVVNGGGAILEDMRSKQIVLGSVGKPSPFRRMPESSRLIFLMNYACVTAERSIL